MLCWDNTIFRPRIQKYKTRREKERVYPDEITVESYKTDRKEDTEEVRESVSWRHTTNNILLSFAFLVFSSTRD